MNFPLRAMCQLRAPVERMRPFADASRLRLWRLLQWRGPQRGGVSLSVPERQQRAHRAARRRAPCGVHVLRGGPRQSERQALARTATGVWFHARGGLRRLFSFPGCVREQMKKSRVAWRSNGWRPSSLCRCDRKALRIRPGVSGQCRIALRAQAAEERTCPVAASIAAPGFSRVDRWFPRLCDSTGSDDESWACFPKCWRDALCRRRYLRRSCRPRSPV